MPGNPGGGLTPEREGWAPDRLEISGRENAPWVRQGRGAEGPAPFLLPWGYPHVRQPSEMTGPGGPRGPGGPSDPRGPCHSLRKAAERRPWGGFVDP